MRAFHMLSGQRDNRDELLANAVSAAFEPVAAELRLVDPGDFIAYIRDEKFASIQDIVNSSVELFFKPGTVSFGWSADFELDWNSAPVIALGIEFRRGSVWIVFKLILRALQTEVKIEHFSTGRPLGGAKQDLTALAEAVASARLTPHEH